MPITNATNSTRQMHWLRLSVKNAMVNYVLPRSEEAFHTSVNDQIIYNFQILQNLQMSARNFNQTQLSTALDSITTKQYGIYTEKVKNKKIQGGYQ